MNIFYAPPEQITDEAIELTGQEAVHASKALRYKQGDAITVVDGEGGWYEGEVGFVARDRVQVAIQNKEYKEPSRPALTLAMGIIKKRDRLEFAVEKAVELGVQEIVLFPGEHSVKQNIRTDRIRSIILSAMKQSLQAWLPKLKVYNSLPDVITAYTDDSFWVAHQDGDSLSGIVDEMEPTKNNVLFIGPEGGFSEQEIGFLKQEQSRFVLLNANRLRAETASITFLSLLRGH